MIERFNDAYNYLKQYDDKNRLTMANEKTILLSVDNELQVLLHNTKAETYFEFKRNGKRFAAYRTDDDKCINDMLGYINGTNPIPDAGEYNKKNTIVAVMLVSVLAVIAISYLILDYSAMTLATKKIVIMTLVIVTLAIEIGITRFFKK